MGTQRMIRRKLLAGWIASAVLLLVVTGLVFAVMLRSAERDHIRSNMAGAFGQIAQRLGERSALVARAADLAAQRRETVAGLHLLVTYEDLVTTDAAVFNPERRMLAALFRDEARTAGVDALGVFAPDGAMVAAFSSGRASGAEPGAAFAAWVGDQRVMMPLDGDEPLSRRIGLESLAPDAPPEAVRQRLVTVHDHFALLAEAPVRRALGEQAPEAIGMVVAGLVFGPEDIADIAGRSGVEVAIVPEGQAVPESFRGIDLERASPELVRAPDAWDVQAIDGRFLAAAALTAEGGRNVHILLAADQPRLAAVLSTYGEASLLALLPVLLVLIPAGAFALQRWVILPLEALARAADAVRQGRAADVRLAERDDELGRVARAFNDMVRDLVARENDLRQSVDQLSRMNTELSQFAHVAAHDLREPVRQIVTYTQLLERSLDGNLTPEQTQSMGYIVGSARRMYDLIGALLDYAGSERGSGRRHEVDARAVVETVVDTLRMTIEGSGAKVTIGTLPIVRADEVQLAQVFQNLISNALKFHAPDRPPEVEITAESAGPDWIFRVRDNGIGFDPDLAERVFDMFERLHVQGGYAGTGIGLPICRKIVDTNGGRIWATSRPGEGSTFSFLWPGVASVLPENVAEQV